MQSPIEITLTVNVTPSDLEISQDVKGIKTIFDLMSATVALDNLKKEMIGLLKSQMPQEMEHYETLDREAKHEYIKNTLLTFNLF